MLLNVSFGGGMLGWACPYRSGSCSIRSSTGRSSLLTAPSLRPLWTTCYNMPLVPYTNFNNTVVLESLVGWLVLVVPIYLWG